MTPLDLAPFIITPGHHVIARRVESDRAREAYSRKRIAELRKAREMFA